MKQYFINKDEIKAIKEKRQIFMSDKENICRWESVIDIEDYCTYDCIVDKLIKKCPYCEQRHQFYLELQKLSHSNGAILRQVKRIVNKPEVLTD